MPDVVTANDRLPLRFGLWAARDMAIKMARDEIPGRAAQIAFYFFLSLFPILLILTVTLGILTDAEPVVRTTLLEWVAAIAPAPASDAVAHVLDAAKGDATLPLTWGIVLAFWAGSSGMVAIIRGLNRAYGVTEARSWWRRRLVGIALTLVLTMLLAAAMLLLAYGGPIGREFARRSELGTGFVTAWRIGQWPLIVLAVAVAFEILFYFAPNRPRARRQWLRIGTVVAIAIWIGASYGLQLYVSHFASHHRIYGPLGAAIVLLLWFYVSGFAILVGAEINARVEGIATRTSYDLPRD